MFAPTALVISSTPRSPWTTCLNGPLGILIACCIREYCPAHRTSLESIGIPKQNVTLPIRDKIKYLHRECLCNKALLLMEIEEFQSLASFILYNIR